MVKQNFLTKMLLLCALIVGSSSVWADDVTFNYLDYKGNGTQSSGSEYTMVKTAVSIKNDKFYGNNSYAHFYASSTSTITPAENITITKIVLTASATNYNGYQSNGTITASTGSVSGSAESTTVTWTGSASSAFTISNNKQIRWTSIVVTYSSGSQSSTYTVTYDANGATSGTVPTDNTEYNSTNNTVTVLGNTGDLAKTHHTFSGWNTKADGTGTNYVENNTFTITANTTLYAKWTANTHNVTLPTEDAYGTYTMSATNPVAYGTEVTLTYTPASGYENYVATWSSNDVEINGNKFTMPDNAVTVAVSLEEVNTTNMVIDFENAVSNYTDWTFTNISGKQTDSNVPAHGGSYFGVTGGTATASILTKEKVNPVSLTCYVSKKTTNTSTSTWYIQVSTDGNTWTNVKSVDGASMTRGTWRELSDDLSSYTDVYVRVFYNGSTAVRCIDDLVLTVQGSEGPSIIANGVVDIAFDATSGEIPYSIMNPVDGTSLAVSVEDGCDWITDVTVGSESVTFSTSVNEGDERSADITLTYGEVTKTVTVTQAKLPFTITDGVFDFTQDEDYDSGLAQSGVKVQTSTWTAVNVTMVMTGRNCWYNNNPDQIRLYKANGNDAAGSITLSVPEGSVITNIAFTGASFGNMSPDDENCSYNSTSSSATWEGVANSVTFTASERTDIETIIVTYISMPSSVSLAPAKTYTTLTSAYNLDFRGLSLKAFIVLDNDASDGKVTMTQVNKVPAGTGLVIKAETTGTPVEVPVFDGSDADDVTGNKMQGSATKTTAIGANEGYILKDGAFHPSSGNGVLAAGKAYLAIAVNDNAPALSMDFGEGTTGIQSIERTINDNQYYTLDGRRVAQPTKGLYIVNGKKVLVP